jgi:formylmethanofuran dehydrogenase subunit E
MITEDVMVNCSRCEEPTHDSELMQLGSWWLCGICWDDV